MPRWVVSAVVAISPYEPADGLGRCCVSDHVLASRGQYWIWLGSPNHGFRLPGSFNYLYLHARVPLSSSQSKGSRGTSSRSSTRVGRQLTVQVACYCSLLRVLGVSLIFNLVREFVLMGHRLWTPFFFIGDFSEYRGFSSDLSFYMLSIMNGMSMIGRLVNFIADKVGRSAQVFVAMQVIYTSIPISPAGSTYSSSHSQFVEHYSSQCGLSSPALEAFSRSPLYMASSPVRGLRRDDFHGD